ncbi:PREDICTED: nuclear apoptosis-inducing factor 1-like isoform X2 [Priapulus caudatus]|uniref:Regulatory protein zeste n=1 Tax=Priapulus caudatus TaxID=37621 RepID=A0ABM1F0S3_PRICU|nr:PREDICTED: nuclear apoptosis-inducing factor 1-like isoform X2 [Priapulus caudatus]
MEFESERPLASAEAKRRPNWRREEIEVLAEACLERQDVVRGRLSNNLTVNQKNDNWREIADSVNAIGMMDRHPAECKIKWTNYTSELRKKERHNATEARRTGGGQPSVIQFSDIESQVIEGYIPPEIIYGVTEGVEITGTSTADASGVAILEPVIVAGPGPGPRQASPLRKRARKSTEKIEDMMN